MLNQDIWSSNFCIQDIYKQKKSNYGLKYHLFILLTIQLSINGGILHQIKSQKEKTKVQSLDLSGALIYDLNLTLFQADHFLLNLWFSWDVKNKHFDWKEIFVQLKAKKTSLPDHED